MATTAEPSSISRPPAECRIDAPCVHAPLVAVSARARAHQNEGRRRPAGGEVAAALGRGAAAGSPGDRAGWGPAWRSRTPPRGTSGRLGATRRARRARRPSRGCSCSRWSRWGPASRRPRPRARPRTARRNVATEAAQRRPRSRPQAREGWRTRPRASRCRRHGRRFAVRKAAASEPATAAATVTIHIAGRSSHADVDRPRAVRILGLPVRWRSTSTSAPSARFACPRKTRSRRATSRRCARTSSRLSPRSRSRRSSAASTTATSSSF